MLALLLLAAEQDPSQPVSHDALYASLSAVAVALIGGAVAVITSRRTEQRPAPPEPAPTSQTAEPSALLPRALVDLLEQEVERKDRRVDYLEAALEAASQQADADHELIRVWSNRAYQAGYRDPA